MTEGPSPLGRGAVARLGLAQLIGWGISFYLPGALGEAIVSAQGWSRSQVYGGLSAALCCMALLSPLAGEWIDRYGGRRVMCAGACCNALGCLIIAGNTHIPVYYLGWLVLGVGMRLTLYDALSTSLAQGAREQAREAMARVTLLGGLASTVFWPLGQGLLQVFGWRGALCVYALFALACLPLLRSVPGAGERSSRDGPVGGPEPRNAVWLAGPLFTLMTMLTSFLSAGLSAHLPGLLDGLGSAGGWSVGVAALWGFGQLCARFVDMLYGARLPVLLHSLLAAACLPVSLAIGWLGGAQAWLAALFVFGYGAANGLAAIVRAGLPLVLFGAQGYGARVGRLLLPSYVLSAIAPLAYAEAHERLGARPTLGISVGIGVAIVSAALALFFVARSGMRDSAVRSLET